MEFNKNLDLVKVGKYIDTEIDEKNTRWAEQFVDKARAEQMFSEMKEPTKEEDAVFEKIFKQISGEDEQSVKKINKGLSDEERDTYHAVGKYRKAKGNIEFATEGMEELEKFLGVASKLKKEVADANLVNANA